jgi:hypothetical protein
MERPILFVEAILKGMMNFDKMALVNKQICKALRNTGYNKICPKSTSWSQCICPAIDTFLKEFLTKICSQLLLG